MNLIFILHIKNILEINGLIVSCNLDGLERIEMTLQNCNSNFYNGRGFFEYDTFLILTHMMCTLRDINIINADEVQEFVTDFREALVVRK
jgi:hypothetical protein